MNQIDKATYQRKFGVLQDQCPVRAALDVLRGRWKPSILYQLSQGVRRFSDLQAALPRISAQALTRQLKELEADGLITRTVLPEAPVRVEYQLSLFGTTLSSVMDSLEAWGEEYLRHRKKHL